MPRESKSSGGDVELHSVLNTNERYQDLEGFSSEDEHFKDDDDDDDYNSSKNLEILVNREGEITIRNEEGVSESERRLTNSVENYQTSSFRRCLSFMGPGSMVAVGYMDPGNWSTDIAGGSTFGYSLLFVVLLSSICGIFLQALSVKVGIASSKGLAELCRDNYPKNLNYVIWFAMELAIMATDLAEVIGSAIALKLLFGIPLVAGVFLTIIDVFLLLYLSNKGVRYTEAIVAILICLITVCFAIEIGLTNPNAKDVMMGYLPNSEIFRNKRQLFVGIGILGATVMPHNIYLHSSIILSREMKQDEASLHENTKFAQIDSFLSLCGAFFVNSAILILASSAFYVSGHGEVTDISEAYKLLAPLLGGRLGQILFGVALLASGLNATLTGTLAGQIVMEGFTTWTIPIMYRRILTRVLAIAPAAIAVIAGGEKAINNMLLYSQVILSLALPFAVFPLAHISGKKEIMGTLVNKPVTKYSAYIIAFILLALNIFLLTTF